MSWRDVKLSDIVRSIRAGDNWKERMRAIFGWALIGVGFVGLVLPVIPGAFLIVVGAALTGWRHPVVDTISEPMFRLSEALPENKIPPQLRPLWAAWRKLDARKARSQNETSLPNISP